MTGVDKKTVNRLFVGSVMLVGVASAALLAVRLSSFWMLIFGSVLVAVILRSIADPLVRRAKLNDGLAVLVAVLLVVLIIAGVALLFGRRLGQQAALLAEWLPTAWNFAISRIQDSPLGDRLFDIAMYFARQAGRLVLMAQSVVLSVVSAVTTMVLVVVAGIYLAIQPAKSRDGVLALVPMRARPRLREIMDACGRALKGWLRAQLVSMLVVGTLIGVGLWFIGLPSPGLLGLMTGLAEFVPIVGPIAAAIPALLIAATSGWDTFLWTLVLYLVVAQLEANFITPLVQKNVAELPIVFGIFAVVAFGGLFGALGVLFATPLALVLFIAITMLYREDVLRDPEAKAPGELKE